VSECARGRTAQQIAAAIALVGVALLAVFLGTTPALAIGNTSTAAKVLTGSQLTSVGDLDEESQLTHVTKSALPGLYTGDYPPRFLVRPASIGGWTGNGTGIVGGPDGRTRGTAFDPGHVKWATWNGRRAEGRGVVWAKGCSPDCAAGAWKKDGATTIVAWRPRRGRFTRLAFSYDDGRGWSRHVFRLRGGSNPAWIG
jgi:hypothetical protein